MHPVGAEVDHAEKRVFRLGRREKAERVPRHRAVVTGPLDRVFDRTVACEEGHRSREVAVLLLLLLHGPAPEGALLFVAPAKRQNHGQGDLAVAEVVADRFAQDRLACVVVQGIIHQLIGDAEVEAEAFERLFLGGGALGHHPRRAGKRRRRAPQSSR